MTARKVENHVEIEEMDARAGQTGMHVRYILAFSTLLVLAGFGAVAIFFT
ncbi:MAG: hypothetical protein NW206_07945 [Hyphomonadaceae bacterium]|nr:hypothetical protein [Hyphomonadaceae bacterium]